MLLTFNNVIVWRHAEAERADESLDKDDLARMLTSKGRRQARSMARWLKQNLPKDTMLLCSPAVRCVQTAEALKYKITVHQALHPEANLQELVGVLTHLEYARSNLLIVGHQPWLGQLVTHLTGFSGAELNIKKGAIWWLRQSFNQAYQYHVLSVLAPNFLPK